MEAGTTRTELSYWAAYGGWGALFTSTYFWGSVGLTLVQFRAWMVPGWWDVVLQTLPNLVGFGLGGYAILLSFGDDKFRALLVKAGSKTPLFMKISATFVHFIVVQLLALMFALVCKNLYTAPLHSFEWLSREESRTGAVIAGCVWGLGYLVFVYSLACAAAATFAIYTCSRWLCSLNRGAEPAPAIRYVTVLTSESGEVEDQVQIWLENQQPTQIVSMTQSESVRRGKTLVTLTILWE